MNNQKIISLMLFLCICLINYGQEKETNEEGDYVEFNDRNNVVHGVYLGLNMRVGEIMDKDAFMAGLKVAYVANQQFEVGFEGNFLYSEQDIYNTTLSRNEDLIGVYGGLHLEPILFSKSRVNLSFPLLIGAGGVGYIDSNYIDSEHDEELDEDDFDGFVVAEPGINVLFNVSRYLQLEAGIKYRFTSKIDLVPHSIDRVNGFSAGIGIKVGVFNLGRNRYKKKISE
ncbi:hypothetical protein GH721_02300 [Kriegella sp. EG-1]|nr:hypothetical protein [Flavobacteriaceae bacterium EG-1]